MSANWVEHKSNCMDQIERKWNSRKTEKCQAFMSSSLPESTISTTPTGMRWKLKGQSCFLASHRTDRESAPGPTSLASMDVNIRTDVQLQEKRKGTSTSCAFGMRTAQCLRPTNSVGARDCAGILISYWTIETRTEPATREWLLTYGSGCEAWNGFWVVFGGSLQSMERRDTELCIALKYNQYEWGNCTVAPKLQSANGYNLKSYSNRTWWWQRMKKWSGTDV